MKKIFYNYSVQDWILVFLRVVMGALFLFSGFVKLIPIEPFELKFIELGVANWTMAPFVARLIIAGELFLGLMLIFNIKPRYTAIATLSVLVFFTLYLSYDIIKNGNDGNCGCFGTFIVMTPMESIVKNLLMIPLMFVLLVMNKKAFNLKPLIFIIVLAVLSIASPFVLYPVGDIGDHVNSNSEKVDYAFPAELIPDIQWKGRKIDLSRGQHIVAFMSVTCVHCKNAAYKLHILNKQNQLPPIYLVLMGPEDRMPDFIKETKADFPYYFFNQNNFFKIAGNSMPRIFYLKDGKVKAKYDSLTLTEEALLEALKK